MKMRWLIYDVVLLLILQAPCQIINRAEFDKHKEYKLKTPSQPSQVLYVTNSYSHKNRSESSERWYNHDSANLQLHTSISNAEEMAYTRTQYMQINGSVITLGDTMRPRSNTRSMETELNITREYNWSSQTMSLSRQIKETKRTEIMDKTILRSDSLQVDNNTITWKNSEGRNKRSTYHRTLHKQSISYTDTLHATQTIEISDYNASRVPAMYTSSAVFQSDGFVKSRESFESFDLSKDRISSSLYVELSTEISEKTRTMNDTIKSNEITSITPSQSMSASLITPTSIQSQSIVTVTRNIISSQELSQLLSSKVNTVPSLEFSKRDISSTQNRVKSSQSTIKTKHISLRNNITSQEISTQNMLTTSWSESNTQSANIHNGNKSICLQDTISVVDPSGNITSLFCNQTIKSSQSTLDHQQLNETLWTSHGFINTVTRSKLDLQPSSETHMLYKTTVSHSGAHVLPTTEKLPTSDSGHFTGQIVTSPAKSSYTMQTEASTSSRLYTTSGYSVVKEIITKIPTTKIPESDESHNFTTGDPNFPFYYVLAICLPLAFLLGFTLAILYFRRARQENAAHYSVTVEVSAQKPDYEMKRMYSIIDINSGNINKDLWPEALRTDTRGSMIDTTSKVTSDVKKDFKA